METSNIIIILLFIVPGILSQQIYNSFELPNKKIKSEFIQLIENVALSLPILFITILIFQKGIVFVTSGCNFVSVDEFAAALKNVDFLLKFSISVLINAVLCGIARGILYTPCTGLRNLIRRAFGVAEIDNKSCWTSFLAGDNNYKFVEIEYADGKTILGFVDRCSLDDESQEIILCDIPLALKYKDKFTTIEKVFLDVEKSLKITMYSNDEYDKLCQV